jgi:hypothetical protein
LRIYSTGYTAWLSAKKVGGFDRLRSDNGGEEYNDDCIVQDKMKKFDYCWVPMYRLASGEGARRAMILRAVDLVSVNLDL